MTIDDVSCRDESPEDWDERYDEPPTPVATGIHPERGIGYRLVGFQVECFREPDRGRKRPGVGFGQQEQPAEPCGRNPHLRGWERESLPLFQGGRLSSDGCATDRTGRGSDDSGRQTPGGCSLPGGIRLPGGVSLPGGGG